MIYLYIKTHNISGLKYFGKTENDPFTYRGSGVLWNKHLKKYGYDISTEIYFSSEDKEEIKRVGREFSLQNNIVESSEWANLVIEEGDGMPKGVFVSEETRMKRSKSSKGHKKKESTKLKMKKPKSEEHKKKIGLSKIGKKRITFSCEYCSREISAGNFNRWHGINCKEYKNAI